MLLRVVLEQVATSPLDHQVGDTLDLACLYGLDDVRMKNAFSEVRFAGEPRQGRLVLAHLVAQRLERHRAVSGMGRTVHDRRPTLADQLVYGVAGYVLTNEVFLGHGREPNATVQGRQATNVPRDGYPNLEPQQLHTGGPNAP